MTLISDCDILNNTRDDAVFVGEPVARVVGDIWAIFEPEDVRDRPGDHLALKTFGPADANFFEPG